MDPDDWDWTRTTHDAQARWGDVAFLVGLSLLAAVPWVLLGWTWIARGTPW